MRVGSHYQYNITSQPYKNLASGLNTPPVKDAQNVVSVGWALLFLWERDFFQLVCSTLSSSKSMCNSAILTRTEYIIKKYKIMLRASCLMLEIKRCYETKIGKVKRLGAARNRTQDTSGLSHQCSVTEPQQLDDH